MNTKVFVGLLFGILVLGIGIGGVFVAFKEFTSSKVDVESQNILQSQSLATSGQENMSQLVEGAQSGEVRQEELSTLREQILARLDQNPGRIDLGAGGVGGPGGLTGDIEKIDGNTITVNTPQGMLQADVLPDSDIRILTQGDVENLHPDITVRVLGQRGEDDTVDAIVIAITGEESAGFRSPELTEEQLNQFRERIRGQFGQGQGADGSDGPTEEQLNQFRERIRGQFGQGQGAGASDGPTEEQLNQFRERIRGQFGQGQGTGASGGPTEEQLNQVRERMRGQFGQGQGAGALTGKIEKIEGDIITLNTAQGQRKARLVDDTRIQMFVEGTLGGLQTGMRVTVLGQRMEGKVEVQSISVIPESTDGLFGNRQE